MGFLSNIFGKVPILGNVAKGIDNTLGRPGDLINHPDQFFGNAIQGASPFLMGPLAGALGTGVQLPGWASTLMGMGGGMGGGGGGNQNLLNSAMGAYGLFGGPKYPDNGMGDKALGYADQSGLAGSSILNNAMQDFADPVEARRRDPNSGTMDYLQGAGMDWLKQGQNLPGLDQMGVLGNMQGLMGQMADQSGVANPFTGQGGQTTNPYDLHPHEQEAYNTTAQMVAQGRQAALNNLRTRMRASGITDPRALAAAEAQIHAGHDTMLTNTHSQLQGQAFQNRQNTLGQFSQMMPQLYGYQNQRQQQNIGNGMNFLDYGNRLGQQGKEDIYRRIGMGQNMLQTPISAYQHAAGQAIGTNADAAEAQARNLRNLFSPWMNQNPFMPQLGRPGQPQQGDQNAMPPWDLTGAIPQAQSNTAPQGMGWWGGPVGASSPAEGFPQYLNNDQYPDLYSQLGG